jgi:hypothetical protein
MNKSLDRKTARLGIQWKRWICFELRQGKHLKKDIRRKNNTHISPNRTKTCTSRKRKTGTAPAFPL